MMTRFEAELQLVERMVRTMDRQLGGHVDRDELRSFGREGLLDAARRFEPEREVPFRAYAALRVRGAMLDGVRRLSRLPRGLHRRLAGLDATQRVSEAGVERAFVAPVPGACPEQAEAALAEQLATMATAMAVGMLKETTWGERHGEREPLDPGASPEESLERAELLKAVRAELDALPEQQSELVRRHYLEGEQFDAVAKDLKISRSWASRLHHRAMARLTKQFRKL